MAKPEAQFIGYIRPDFSDQNQPNTTIASFYYQSKGNKISDNIEGYVSLSIVDGKPLLEKHVIDQDRLVLATMEDGQALYVDKDGKFGMEFHPKGKK